MFRNTRAIFIVLLSVQFLNVVFLILLETIVWVKNIFALATLVSIQKEMLKFPKRSSLFRLLRLLFLLLFQPIPNRVYSPLPLTALSLSYHPRQFFLQQSISKPSSNTLHIATAHASQLSSYSSKHLYFISVSSMSFSLFLDSLVSYSSHSIDSFISSNSPQFSRSVSFDDSPLSPTLAHNPHPTKYVLILIPTILFLSKQVRPSESQCCRAPRNSLLLKKQSLDPKFCGNVSSQSPSNIPLSSIESAPDASYQYRVDSSASTLCDSDNCFQWLAFELIEICVSLYFRQNV